MLAINTFVLFLSTYSNAIGIFGVGLVLLAYYLLMSNHVSSAHATYSLLNLAGAILILVSLYFHWNLASVIIEIAWILISLKGLYKIWVKRNTRVMTSSSA